MTADRTPTDDVGIDFESDVFSFFNGRAVFFFFRESDFFYESQTFFLFLGSLTFLWELHIYFRFFTTGAFFRFLRTTETSFTFLSSRDRDRC